MNWLQQRMDLWAYVIAGLTLLLAMIGSAHALLHKRDSRAATLWVGFIWFVPLIGAVLYFILGVNRIKRRAILLRGDLEHFRARQMVNACSVEELTQRLPVARRHLASLASATAKVLTRPLLPGNRVEVLVKGDAAYPAMLEAIAAARHSVTLSTYIFDRDEVGLAFARVLGEAVRRGVEGRVLIDAFLLLEHRWRSRRCAGRSFPWRSPSSRRSSRWPRSTSCPFWFRPSSAASPWWCRAA